MRKIEIKKVQGFTLIELAIVISIIGILITILAASYSSLIKISRNTKRKSDMEGIKYALEQYRNINSYYPVSLDELVSPNAFLPRVPVDPLANQGYTYQYQPLPLGCTNVDVSTYCTAFTIGSKLEETHSCTTPPATKCYQVFPCNYCLGPYGEYTN